MRCYFDGSKAEPEGRRSWLTLAGFVAGESFWENFSDDWRREVLEKRDPPATFLHMRELYSSSRAFEGFTKDRWNRMVGAAIQYLASFSSRDCCFVVASIDEDAHRRLVAEGAVLPSTHSICAYSCVRAALTWRINSRPLAIEATHLYFDRGEKFMDELRQEWLQNEKRQRRKRLITDPFWGRISEIAPLSSQEAPALQVADLVAWAHSRRHSSSVDRPMRHLARLIETIHPFCQLIFDQSALEKCTQRM